AERSPTRRRAPARRDVRPPGRPPLAPGLRRRRSGLCCRRSRARRSRPGHRSRPRPGATDPRMCPSRHHDSPGARGGRCAAGASGAVGGPRGNGYAGSVNTAPEAEHRPGAPGDDPATTPAAPRKQRPARVVFGSTVLWSEVLVVFFALLVAYGLRVAEPATLSILAAVGMVSCAVAARLQRSRAGIAIGSAVQLLLLLGGLLVPMMFVVGGVFTVIWALGVWLGLKIDRERAERDARPSTLGG